MTKRIAVWMLIAVGSSVSAFAQAIPVRDVEPQLDTRLR